MTDCKDVADWLKSNPDFFAEHPELLDEINLSHPAGTTSLIERQVERLRTENRRLDARLKTLAGIAGENERLMQRLHQLTLEVMTADSTSAFIEQLFDKLAADFKADCVRLHLIRHYPELESCGMVATLPEQRPDWLEKLLDKGETLCGRLTSKKMQLLFGEQADSLGSAALVPIPGTGILTIGAESVERFHPGMGTLFLELLGTTIRYRLERSGAEHRKRA
jgi:uncharacterized protein